MEMGPASGEASDHVARASESCESGSEVCSALENSADECASMPDAILGDESLLHSAGDPSANLRDLACDLDGRLSAFLQAVGDRKAEHERWFGADGATRSLFQQLSHKMRTLGSVYFRGDDGRRAPVNELLHPELALLEAPLYSIHFEHGSESSDVVFLKRNFGGWCVEIDRDTFGALAYGSGESSPRVRDNTHSLIVRGNVLRNSLPVLARLRLVVACDDSVHVAREKMLEQRKKEADDRAQELGFSGAAAQVSAASVMSNLGLSELHLCFKGAATEVSVSRQLSTRCSTSSLTADACVCQLLQVASSNLDRIMEVFAACLCKSAFTEKVEYWSNLRLSEATSQKLLTQLFDACLCGSNDKTNVFESACTIAEQYSQTYPGSSRDYVAQKLVQWQASLNLSTGFVTGFGGFLTMPVTIPTGLLATWITSTRLAFAVAHVHGHDIFHPRVANAVLFCLTGSVPEEAREGPDEWVRDGLQECKQLWDPIPEDCTLEDCTLEAEENPQEPQEDNQITHCSPLQWEFQMRVPTLYDLLEVLPNATQLDIRIAYRRLALRYHPDKLLADTSAEEVRAATENFQMLAAAYEELGDPARRKAYDAKRQKGAWTWADFSWNPCMASARDAFEAVSKNLTEALFADQHDLSAHMVSRAATQVAMDLVEFSSVGAAVRAGSAAELRTSIVAGEKLAASATARSSSKLIPILGALISGAIDCATTASVGRCSIRVFKE